MSVLIVRVPYPNCIFNAQSLNPFFLSSSSSSSFFFFFVTLTASLILHFNVQFNSDRKVILVVTIKLNYIAKSLAGVFVLLFLLTLRKGARALTLQLRVEVYTTIDPSFKNSRMFLPFYQERKRERLPNRPHN